METKNKEKEELEKKIRNGLIAGLTSASVMVGGAFESPNDVINSPNSTVKPIIEQIHENTYNKLDKLSLKDDIKEQFRNIVYKIPINIRTYVCVPLWFIGTGILTLLDIIFKLVIAPLAHIAFNLALHLLLLVGAVAACVKILFPDLPWSRIFNKRTLMMILLGSITLSVCDLVMPIVWDKYLFYRNISKLLIGISFLLIILKPFIKKKLDNLYSYDIEYD